MYQSRQSIMGYQRVRECLDTPGQDLCAAVADMCAARFLSQANADVFGGALCALLAITNALEATGRRITDDGSAYAAYLRQTPAAREIALLAAVSKPNASQDLEVMLSALCGLALSVQPVLTWKSQESKESPPPPPPLNVNVLSMPERHAETMVTRDQDENIIKVVRIETDAD